MVEGRLVEDSRIRDWVVVLAGICIVLVGILVYVGTTGLFLEYADEMGIALGSMVVGVGLAFWFVRDFVRVWDSGIEYRNILGWKKRIEFNTLDSVFVKERKIVWLIKVIRLEFYEENTYKKVMVIDKDVFTDAGYDVLKGRLTEYGIGFESDV